MRASWQNRSYEMTLVDYIRFLLHKSWFVRRRFMRSAKRLWSYAANWSIPFILFFATSAIVFVLTSCLLFGEIKADSVAFSFASTILCSFLLLFLKECRDIEYTRNAVLKRQYKLCMQARCQFQTEFAQIVRQSGCTLASGVSLFSNKAADIDVIRISCEKGDQFDSSRSRSALADTLNSHKYMLLAREYVDINEDQALLQIDGALNLLRKADFGQETHDLSKLYGYLFCYIQELRKPWAYTNDQTRKKLVNCFLENHAVLISRV